MESRDLVKEIKEALLSSDDATDFAGSVADLTLDELLNDDFLGKLPIVSWIIQGKRVYSSISDRLFLEKMAAFLIQLSKSPSSKAESQIWNAKTQEMDQCYNAQYTDDGEQLHYATWEVLQSNKS